MSSETLAIDVPLRWGDMDAYGHVNNVQVVRIMEEARVAAFGPPAGTGEAGFEAPVPVFTELPEGTQALVAENHVKYRSPLAYRTVPARVEIWIEKVAAASLTVGYAIRDGVDGRLCAEASTVLAFFHEPTGRLLRISAEQRELLRGYVREA